jgi:FkbM family methyltransferase
MDHQHAFLRACYPWEIGERSLARELLRHGDVAFDVGANLGTHSITFALAVGASGRVVAYDPEPELLYRNVRQLPQVCVRPFAVASRGGTVHFRHEAAATSYSHLVPHGVASRTDTVTVAVSLDEEAGRLGVTRVDLIKVDVEGWEDAVLAGAARLLSTHPRPILIFEWEPRFKTRWTMGGAMTQLRHSGGEGWSAFAMLPDTRTLLSLEGWLDLPTAATIFAAPAEREYAVAVLKHSCVKSPPP